MSESNEDGRFLTVDCIDVFIDEPGDTTVRPVPEYRLKQLKELRDQILAAEAEDIKAPQGTRQT